MEAIQILYKALSKNYYQTFLIPIESEEEINSNNYYEWIIYKDEEYIEKNIFLIRKDFKKIIKDLKPIYIEAVSETYIILANLKSNAEILNFLTNTIKLYNVLLIQLLKDISIDNEESNYFSKLSDSKNYISFNDVLDEFMKMTSTKSFNDKRSDKSKFEFRYDEWDFRYFYLRTKYLGFLPTALYTIANCFIIFLSKIIAEINVELPEEKSNQLTSNQIVILLDHLQIFGDSKINDYPKTKQADLLNLITGLNTQNFRVNIAKLDKKLSELSSNYKKDYDKIEQILKGFK